MALEKAKKITIFFIKTLLIGLLVYYVVKDIEFGLFLDEVQKYSIVSLLLVSATLLLSDIVLAFRWLIISRDDFKPSLESTLVTATMNILLPARIGEIARAIYLKKYYNKSFSRTVSFIIFERFFDMLFLASGALFVLLVLVDNPTYKPIFIGIIIFQILLLLVVKYYNTPILAMTKIVPIRHLRVYAKKIVITISRKIKSAVLFYTVSITLIVWIMNFAVTFAFLYFATDFELSMIEIFVVFVITAVGFALPLLPAGALTFQASYVFALGLYDISQSEALAASLVFHIIYIITMIAPGKIILLYKNSDF